MPRTIDYKGKARAVPRDEGDGAQDGIVLPLQVVGTGVYDIAYTIEMRFGASAQKLSLQVDTGSSDLWVASSSCSSSACSQTGGHNYNPASSTSTGQSFSINYLQGNVSGPILWDSVELGGYSIENQAFAAADSVTNEPLASSFNGILGLALPLNSIIAQLIPPVTSNNPDGAAWASNLFSITPVSSAPSARFLSLALSRPGSDSVQSVLGIGRHPSALVHDPSKIQYSTLVSERSGTLFWKLGVRAITVYANGENRPVQVGRSNTGAVFPSAVLDSGVPLILTTSKVANGIYGAIGVSPASDGQYYVPCTTPLNMTITLDDRSEIPLHPLDLTAEPPKDNKADYCIGLIQAADGVLASPTTQVGDMILGVPFMRNVYTVMAYAVPDADGTFPPHSGESAPVKPRLGLLGLTDPTVALDEFRRVRVLNQPLGGSQSGGTSNSNPPAGDDGRKLSVGIIVLIGLLGFFALCFTLFAIRWFCYRRRYRRAAGAVVAGATAGALADNKRDLGAYVLARRTSRGSHDEDDDNARYANYKAYMKEEASETTMSSVKTRVVDDEFGVLRPKSGAAKHDETWDDPAKPAVVDWGDDTLVEATRTRTRSSNLSPTELDSTHHRTLSDASSAASFVAGHQRTNSVAMPLLPPLERPADLRESYRDRDQNHGREDEGGEDGEEDDDDAAVDEFGNLRQVTSMAGIGTAARGGKIDPAFRSSLAET